jgi:hypothetical protein
VCEHGPRGARGRFCRDAGIPPEPVIVRKQDSDVLRLAHFGLGDTRAQGLAQALVLLQNIVTVDIQDNRFSDRALAGLVLAVRDREDTASLLLGSNTFGLRAAAAVGEVLAAGIAPLTVLNVASAGVNDGVLGALCKALEHGDVMSTLVLRDNGITAAGAPHLARVLSAAQPRLGHLDLSWNRLLPPGATALAAALPASSLRWLSLAFNGIGDDGSCAIARAAGRAPLLAYLSLGSNGINGRGAFVLADTMTRNSALIELELSGNPIGILGARALVRSVLATAGGGEEPRVIGLADCAMSLNESLKVFDADAPAGAYALNLEDPYDRCIASALVDVARSNAGVAFEACVLKPDGGAAVPLTLVRVIDKVRVLRIRFCQWLHLALQRTTSWHCLLRLKYCTVWMAPGP